MSAEESDPNRNLLTAARARAARTKRAAFGRARTARLRRQDPEVLNVIREVQARRLTYLEESALVDLAIAVREVEAHGLDGSLIEAGCALGGSAIVLAQAKAKARPLQVFDVFGTIPPPSEEDGSDVQARYQEIAAGAATGIDGDTYYGYQPELKKKVAESFAALGVPVDEFNVALVEGLFEDTVRPDGPVALAHIDGDWYDSVSTCLNRIWPHLVAGGTVIVDDYYHWSGCRRAVDEFMASHQCQVRHRSRLHLKKTI